MGTNVVFTQTSNPNILAAVVDYSPDGAAESVTVDVVDLRSKP
jgi:hypothetical protein